MPDADRLLDELYDALLDGRRAGAVSSVQQLLAAGMRPDRILYEGMIPAMNEVGRLFEQGEVFVPEMLVAAYAMKGGMELLQPLLENTGAQPVAKVVMGTVQGDVHDIGKNLAIMMLKGAGFEVVDLGVNVPPERFVEAATAGANIVGMSALLTTTMPNMKMTIDHFVAKGLRQQVKIIVGGAPVTQEFADQIGADGYGANANQAVTVAKTLLGIAA